MIRFSCGQCGCRISVPDENAGRMGKCPKCKNAMLVPKKLNTIELQCEKCGQKISVLRKKSTQTGHCPNCKNTITVTGAEKAVSKPKKETPDDTNSYLLGNDAGLMLLEMPDELKLQDLPEKQHEAEQASAEQELYLETQAKEAALEGERSLPWFIDIFLYPLNFSGLTHLAVFTGIPAIIAILRTTLGGLSRFGRLVGLPGLIINGLVFLYMGWYFTECVRDSAKGGLRAPEAFASMGAGEMWQQVQHVIGCYLIFISPAFFYNLYTHNFDAVYWGLLVTGSFLFPMGLLACIMFDSVRGLNPILLLASIFSTFFQYCLLALLTAGIVFAFTTTANMLGADNTQKPATSLLIIGAVFFFFALYAAFVIAHLTGRFYWRNEEKLNWEC